MVSSYDASNPSEGITNYLEQHPKLKSKCFA